MVPVSGEPSRHAATEQLAFCSQCKGVLPFAQVRRARLECQRCGTLYRRSDPGGAGRRSALRYFIYSCAAGLMASISAAAAAALGPEHPMMAPQRTLFTWVLVALSVGCLARAIGLRLHAADFESLTSWEVNDLNRRLCPGMIRSDVVDEMARRGWRIGKIRTALEALKPAG